MNKTGTNSQKTWFKKGHQMSPESLAKMIKSKTKYTPEEKKQREKDRKNSPERKKWTLEYGKTPERKYSMYKSSAKTKKLDFLITFEEFMIFWNKNCSYCNEPIETIGLDRINSEIGYVLSNLCSSCSRCNYMKNNSSTEDFINQCKKITLWISKQ